MRILINDSFSERDHAEVSRFLQECFKRIMLRHPEHQFFFINATPSLLAPPSKLSLRRKIWYSSTLPKVLKKQQINLVIHADKAISLKTTVPQLLLVPQLPLKFHFLQKQLFLQSLQKANTIIVPAIYLQKKLAEKYQASEENITVIHPVANEVNLADHEKHNIKQHYTEGKEFFVYAGPSISLTGFTNLLKAFSLFKKRQKSNMLLLILTRTAADMQQPAETMKTYKYRDEIKLMIGLSEKETNEIIAGAYAFVYPSYYENSGLPVLQAMKCNVPVIVSDIEVLQELCGDAALYMSPDSPEAIAERMMLLYKDERSRSTLIKRASKRVADYNWDYAAEKLWAAMLHAVKQ